MDDSALIRLDQIQPIWSAQACYVTKQGVAANVVYGIYNLENRTVSLPADGAGWQPDLSAPPANAEALSALSRHLAVSGGIMQARHEAQSGQY